MINKLEKQIIIDGVDVSKCNYFNNTDKSCCEERCSEFGCAICNDRPNCYYKQLQREKQNSQEAIDISIKEFNRAEEFKTLLKRKEQECEELKKQLQGDNCLIITSIGKMNYQLLQKYYKLKTILAEIKGIAENMNNECFYDDFECKDCDMKNGCTYFNKKQILQKISEVEDER